MPFPNHTLWLGVRAYVGTTVLPLHSRPSQTGCIKQMVSSPVAGSKKYLETGSELLVVKHFKFFRRTNDIQLLKNCPLQGFDAFPSQPYNSIVQYIYILVNSYKIKINCGMLKIILYL